MNTRQNPGKKDGVLTLKQLQCFQCECTANVDSMSDEVYSVVRLNGNIKWFCDKCVKNVCDMKLLSKSIDDIKVTFNEKLDKLNDVNASIKTKLEETDLGLLNKSIDEISKSLDEKVNAISANHVAIKSQLDSIEFTSGKKLNQEISGLKSEMMRSFASVVSTEVKQSAKIINEDLKNVRKTLNDVANAKEREANAMLFRLGEGLDDKDRVIKMIAKLTDDTVNGKKILKVFRLGKRGEGVVRPILIKFDDVKSKEYFFTNLYILRSLNEDFAHVKLSHDLTVDQRKELKRILDDAKARETNCKEGFYTECEGRWEGSNVKYNVTIGLLNVRSISKRVDDVHGLLCDGLDILVLTETWHGLAGNISINLAMPAGYQFVDFVRQHDPGLGGLIVYFRKEFKYKKIILPQLTTLEAVAIQFWVNGSTFILIVIYRPGSAQLSVLFFQELVSVLEQITVLGSNVLLMGDFNVHLERTDDPYFIRLGEVFETFQSWKSLDGNQLARAVLDSPIFGPCAIKII
ncbi:hypothetical protein HELRODRAFT_182601 [Helobdella robusta]|uniref:Endonuclease/exonuclease/phosphatase domain-containing protein n=1 Tax=Helobdella robusta TaxID=6412 RepID=T1FIG2_HELRO|nr:hypothetical protein HELRODRAFT_182601 [Helobdella robusta]ESN90773.1 hypothetical protein HELRODRAFT_182601 [Helobdella robusta]